MKSSCFLRPVSFIALVAIMVGPMNAAPVFAQATGAGSNYETRLSDLEDQQRALNGRIEQLEFAIRRMDTNLQKMQSDNDLRLQRLEATQQQQVAPVAQVAPNSTEPPPAMESPNGTVGTLKMQNGKVVGGEVNPQAPPLPQTPADYGLTPQEQYDAAFALLRQADYDGAEKAFKNFIDKNPKEKLLSNAKYWYGETLYVRGKLDEAAVAFADAWQQDPQGAKAPDSLLKLSMSLAAIDKIPDACTALGELKAKYPNASPTIRSRASEESSKIKCAAH